MEGEGTSSLTRRREAAKKSNALHKYGVIPAKAGIQYMIRGGGEGAFRTVTGSRLLPLRAKCADSAVGAAICRP